MISENKKNKKLPLPNFLAFDFKGFNFNFTEKPNHSKDENYVKRLLKNYSNPNTIVLFNGKVIYSSFPKQVKVYTCENHQKNFESYKHSKSYNLLTHYNKTYLNSGLSLHFIKNCKHLTTLNIIIAGSVNISHYSNYVLKENAKVKLEEQFVLFNGVKLNYILNTNLHDQSELQHLYVQTLKNKKSNTFTHNVTIGVNGKLELSYLNLNSAKTVNNSFVELRGKYAKAKINTVTVANDNVRLASLITIKHLNKETESYINNVGIVNDSAQVNIDGLNIIEKGNAKSIADQTSKIINLTNEARSIANPQLIINEYDVKAGHSASVGRLDDEQIYYLMSRGLTKHQSVELLLYAHLNEGLEKINDQKLKNNVLKIINKKII